MSLKSVEIKLVQDALVALGYLKKGVRYVEGVFDEATREAHKMFSLSRSVHPFVANLVPNNLASLHPDLVKKMQESKIQKPAQVPNEPSKTSPEGPKTVSIVAKTATQTPPVVITPESPETESRN